MFNNILSLFLKSDCPLCQRSTDNIICQYCEQKLNACKLTNNQQFEEANFIVFPWGKYDSYLKRAIASFKYDQHKNLGELFGSYLGEAWLKSCKKKQFPQLIVIPIPLHPDKLKIRGFNQAELIARSFCDITGYPLKTNLLIRVKNTEAMFGLTPEERKNNINRAFSLGKDYQKINPSQKILIVDDIYTTGTTIHEAKKILNQGNLNIIGVATVSITENQNS